MTDPLHDFSDPELWNGGKARIGHSHEHIHPPEAPGDTFARGRHEEPRDHDHIHIKYDSGDLFDDYNHHHLPIVVIEENN